MPHSSIHCFSRASSGLPSGTAGRARRAPPEVARGEGDPANDGGGARGRRPRLKKTTILGISAYYHDSAACLVSDAEIMAAAQEQRFSRKKHDHSFPTRAIGYCLDETGLRPDQLDYVAFYDKPLVKFERLLETYLDYAPGGFPSFLKAMPLWMKEKLWLPDLIRRQFRRARRLRGCKGGQASRLQLPLEALLWRPP